MSQEAQLLIEKFWAGTATAAERERLTTLLGTNEASWQARLEAEFAHYPDPATGPLSAEQSARVLRRLHWQLALGAPATAAQPGQRGWLRWVAAAVVLLVAGLAALLGGQHRLAPTPVARVTRPAVPPASHLVTRTNPGPSSLRLPLPDGSVATLQAGAALTYNAPFGAAGRRDLQLQGTALFAVAKDARRPFTVLANGFTTTALGTRFRVQTTAAHRVAVRLLEGRVVVRATPATHLAMRDQYLTPGQELTVDARTRRVQLRMAAPPPTARPLAVEVPTGLSFEKEPLARVLTQVGARYHVRVAYDSADVRGLSFSGDFEATDPLPVVLRAVCAANNLTFTQAPGRVTIRKAP